MVAESLLSAPFELLKERTNEVRKLHETFLDETSTPNKVSSSSQTEALGQLWARTRDVKKTTVKWFVPTTDTAAVAEEFLRESLFVALNALEHPVTLGK